MQTKRADLLEDISGPIQVEVRNHGKQYPFITVAEGFSLRVITVTANDEQELESILVELIPEIGTSES